MYSRSQARRYGARGRLLTSALLLLFGALASVSVGLSLAVSAGDGDRYWQAGIVASVLLASFAIICALIQLTRRQVSRLRTMFEASSELVAVLGEGGCRYVSQSLSAIVGLGEHELLGEGLEGVVHDDDRELLRAAHASGQPGELRLRLRGPAGEWRTLEVKCKDLRSDRHLHGVLLTARDVTDRARLEHELFAQTQRDRFATQLSEALEMADEEDTVCGVIERALEQVAELRPMELLLSDSSRANMRRVAGNPALQAPGCGVKSPYSCVAVRRGTAVVFESSELLNACPHLRGRDTGACSAACVPISFMGRSLGVLHTTGADGEVPGEELIEQLKTIAAFAGGRIGTVRAFQRTQLQASTDGLTGLVNRRSAEARVRDMLTGGHLFAFAIADLDNFKQLNDTHGHEAGDRALRVFGQAAHDVLRENDLVARWGGEEFVIVLPELDRTQAVNVLERVRLRLARVDLGEAPRFTASFGLSDSNQGGTLEEIVHVADAGLYRAKQAGRDRVTIGEPAQASHSRRRHEQDAFEHATDAAGADGELPAGAEVRACRRDLPSMHDAFDEPDPQPSGREIR